MDGSRQHLHTIFGNGTISMDYMCYMYVGVLVPTPVRQWKGLGDLPRSRGVLKANRWCIHDLS